MAADASTQGDGKTDNLGGREMFAKLLSALRVGLVALWTGFWVVVALLIHALTRRPGLPLGIARKVWAPGSLRIVGARLEVRSAERVDFSRSYLFIANHSSQLDIPVVFAALETPLRFLAKDELRRVPLVGTFIRAMGMVFIDRARSEAARRSIDELSRSLQAGMSLMAFPEGTRSPDGRIQDFKTGAFVAAIKSGVPVVPVRICGADRVLPSRSLRIQPGPVSVEIGEPLPSVGLTLEDRRRYTDLVRSRLVEMECRES